MDLTTNGIVVTDANKYVNPKMDHLKTAEKKLLQDINIKNDNKDTRGEEYSSPDEGLEKQETHNELF